MDPRIQGSGAASRPSEPRFLAVGRISRPHGLRGEVRVEIHTDTPERFAGYDRVYLASAEVDAGPTNLISASADAVPYVLEGHRFHGGYVLLKLAGIDDRTQADTLRDLWVWIAPDQAEPLQEGEIYLHDMLELWVVTDEGEELGQIVQIIETGANLVYVVRGTRGELLLPDTDEVVLDVDLEAARVTVHLIEGLRE